MKRSLICGAWLFGLAACDDSGVGVREMPPRPVTTLELRAHSPTVTRSMTGSVSLYRQEQVGFEVGGRVVAVEDVGLEVQGPAFDESGMAVREGDPIAELERTRFAARHRLLEAEARAARKDLTAAQAELALATRTLEREQKVFDGGAGNRQALDVAQSAFEQASARVDARDAAVTAADEQARLAEEDLRDTEVRAPFSGRITAVHTSRGAVVQPGDPIATLTLMDPIYVRVEVSPDDERAIPTGARASVYPKDPATAEPLPIAGIVYEKSAVADERLRTFQIDLIVRNQRRHVHELVEGLDGLPVVNEYLPVIREFLGERGPMFVQVDCLVREDDETFVYRLPGVSLASDGTRGARGRHVPEKVRVELGDAYTTVIRWNFRSLADPGGLREGDFVIRNPEPAHLAGVAVGRPEWLFRPGDIVPVRFELGTAPRGFYVPVGAIMRAGGTPVVYLLENGRAAATAVSVHELHGELRRIEGQGIEDGARLIVGGVHYVSDGQPVVESEPQ